MGFQKGNRKWDNEGTKANQFKKGQSASLATQFKKGQNPHPLAIEKAKARVGEKNQNWLGDEVGYGALHTWIRKQLGRPDVCSFCGLRNLKGHQIHWANKSRTYQRIIADWLRLCAKCHKAYDTKVTN